MACLIWVSIFASSALSPHHRYRPREKLHELRGSESENCSSDGDWPLYCFNSYECPLSRFCVSKYLPESLEVLAKFDGLLGQFSPANVPSNFPRSPLGHMSRYNLDGIWALLWQIGRNTVPNSCHCLHSWFVKRNVRSVFLGHEFTSLCSKLRTDH